MNYRTIFIGQQHFYTVCTIQVYNYIELIIIILVLLVVGFRIMLNCYNKDFCAV